MVAATINRSGLGPRISTGENTALAQAAALAAAADAAAADADRIAAEAAAATLASITPSANTLALRSAVRTNGFFPQPLWRCPAGDVATITVPAANAAPTIPSYAGFAVDNTAKIKFLAGTADKDVNTAFYSRGAWNGASRQTNYNSIEFTMTGTKCEVYVLCGFLDGNSPNFRVLVNDRIAGTAFIPADGAFRPVAVQFGAGATRRIRIEMSGGRITGVLVANAAEMQNVTRSYPLVTVIADSFGEGAGAYPYDGEAISAIRAIGCNPALAAMGGTGLINPGTGGKVVWTDSNRLSDLALNGYTDKITNAAPDVAMGVVMMSVNDNSLGSTYWNGAANYQDAIKKALWTLVDHWQTNRAGKPLVVFGPTWPNGVPTLDIFRIRDAGQEVCAGQQNVWFIDRLGAAPILRTGSFSRTATTGTLASGSKVITALASTSGIINGSLVLGTGIPEGARVVSIDSGTQVTIDINATASGAGTALTFCNDQAAMYTTTTDTTHPNGFGHNLDAIWMARQLRELILTQFN